MRKITDSAGRDSHGEFYEDFVKPSESGQSSNSRTAETATDIAVSCEDWNVRSSKRLSFRAMGVLHVLTESGGMSLQQLIEYSKDSARPDGRDAIRNIVKELIKARRIDRVMARNNEGQIESTTYVARRGL